MSSRMFKTSTRLGNAFLWSNCKRRRSFDSLEMTWRHYSCLRYCVSNRKGVRCHPFTVNFDFLRPRIREFCSKTDSGKANAVLTPTGEKEGDIVVDIRGEEWMLKSSPNADQPYFWYNRVTWETRNDRPPTTVSNSEEKRPEGMEKPKYATDWYNSLYPEWIEYVELASKRKYYHNTATNEVTWSPPDKPNFDIFKEEILELTKGLSQVPVSAPPATLWRRTAATGVDFLGAFAGGCVFGGLVFLDLEDVVSAQLSLAVSTWCLFMAKDMIFERGTRSPGKRLLKLEIVRVDGQLPSRWNNFFRNFYLPLYTVVGTFPPGIFALTSMELALMSFTAQSQRLGDLVGRTRVIAELPDREIRLKEKADRDDEDDNRPDR